MPTSVEGIEMGRRDQEAWRHVIKVAVTTVYGQNSFNADVYEKKALEFVSVSDKALSRSILIVYHSMLKDERCCRKEQIKTEEDCPLVCLPTRRLHACQEGQVQEV
jgi:hypothetical protein